MNDLYRLTAASFVPFVFFLISSQNVLSIALRFSPCDNSPVWDFYFTVEIEEVNVYYN